MWRGDISELFDTDLEGNAVGGAAATDIRLLCFKKKGFFVDNCPYNFTDYAKKFMGITRIDHYFNAGVTLFDLKKCRELTSEQEAVELLNRREWMYNDRDVLNMLFKDSVYLLDLKWSYTINIDYELSKNDPQLNQLFRDAHCTEYGIIHYTGGSKPWNSSVPLEEHYHRYEKQFKEAIL